MAFPVAGSVRVFLSGPDGREVTLYHVEPGSSCVLSASCILGGSQFPAMAEVERDLVAWVVSAEVFREWIAGSEFWRGFVFRLLGERMACVLSKLEEVSFERVEARLARRLVAVESDSMRITQEQLAAETGTAREVISRIFERWRKAGWIATARGSVRLLDRHALEKAAG